MRQMQASSPIIIITLLCTPGSVFKTRTCRGVSQLTCDQDVEWRRKVTHVWKCMLSYQSQRKRNLTG